MSTVKCNDCVSFSFLFSFFFVKDQTASFQLKQTDSVVFLKCSVCWFQLISSRLIAIEFDVVLNYNRFVQSPQAVDSLNVKHELQYWELSSSVSCRHFKTMFLCLPIENSVLLFVWIKAKESVTSLDGIREFTQRRRRRLRKRLLLKSKFALPQT